MCPAKTQLSLCIWSESSFCALWVALDQRCLHANSKDYDQTARIRMLVLVFAGRTCHFVCFVVHWLKLAFPSPTFRECTAIPVFVQQLFIIHVIKPVSIRFDHQIQSTPWHNRFIVNWCDNRLPPTGLISLTIGTRLAVSYLWLNSNLLF